ncbi:MAG: dual specificity protein phosphatase family protein [Bacteroidota bacterium]
MALIYNFIEIFKSGRVALSERPKLKEIEALASIDCHIVVTILAAKGDQALRIGNTVREHKMEWEWVKVQNAVKMNDADKRSFNKSIKRMLDAILDGKNILIHCSAGLHRTGMFAYCLMIKGGMSHMAAMEAIKEIRLETFNALDEKYLTISEDLLAFR